MMKTQTPRWNPRTFAGAACLLALGLPGPARAADWWTAAPSAMPVRPAPAEAVGQNPPVFSWPFSPAARGHELKLRGPKGEVTWSVEGNALLPSASLPPGSYQWSVRALGASPTDWSDSRSFTIPPGTPVFALPDVAAVWRKVGAAPHPRSLPPPDGRAGLTGGARAADLAALRAKMKPLLGAPLMVEPGTSVDRTDLKALDVQKVAQIGQVRNQLNRELERIECLGWLAMLDGDRSWRDEAIRRVLNLGDWDPRGTTGLVQHDQATRTILLAVAVGYDWFHAQLSADQRARLLEVIRVRGGDLFDRIVASKAVLKSPYDPWAPYTLGYLMTAAPLVAGELPQAETWWRDGLPLYAAIYPSWTGDDGGFANGTAYGLWGLPDSAHMFDILRRATGFDMFAKPAARNYEKVLAYFLPPGAPVGLFGDGAELPLGEWSSRYGKVFAERVRTPLMAWYAGQLSGEERSTFGIVSAPELATRATLPSDTPSHLWLRSIGWVAMHSALEDKRRTSVYFKSSPYGSLNHSHADQNSFVVHARGKVLLADSGVYDFWGSPHYVNWYKQTRAHNAVTHDGGQGQQTGGGPIGSKGASGAVENVDSGAGWVRAVGQAAQAYGGDVDLARRTLVYLKPDVLVVHDRLRAASPKRWEFNLHSPSPWERDDGGWRSGSGDTAVCMDIRSDAASLSAQFDRPDPPPAPGSASAPDWRGVWSLPAGQREAEFVAVVRVGCAAAEVSFPAEGVKGTRIRAGDTTVTVGGGSVLVDGR